ELFALPPTEPADRAGIPRHVWPNTSDNSLTSSCPRLKPPPGARSDPAPLGRTASVVRDGRYVLDHADFQSSGLQGPDRRLTAGARAFHVHFQLPHPVFSGDAGGRLGG